MSTELYDATLAFRLVLDAATTETDDGSLRAFPADSALDAIATALRCTILANRLTLCADTGRELSFIAKDRRILKVVETRPRTLWTSDRSPAATSFGETSGEGVQLFADLLGAVTEGAGELWMTRSFLPYSDAAGHEGFPIRVLTDEIAARSARDPLAPADHVGPILRDFADCPRATLGGSPEIFVPADTAAADAAWFRGLVDRYGSALAETGEGPEASHPVMVTAEEADGGQRIVAAIPSAEGTVLVMAAGSKVARRLEAALSRLGRIERDTD